MSGANLAAAVSGAALTRAVLDLLRADTGVQELFGQPPRIHDGDAGAPAFPFARLERVEESDAGASCVEARDYRLTLSTASRHGGRAFALQLVGALRAALETTPLQVAGQTVVLQQVVYADVMRTADLRRFRGLVRLRIISEEAS